MDDDLQIQDGIVIPASELWFTASRSGGPGGQHVNRTSSKVTLHWDVLHTSVFGDVERARVMGRLRRRINQDGILQLSEESERSQRQNLENARMRLVVLVKDALRVPKQRVPTRPRPAAKRRRVDEKRKKSAIKKLRRSPKGED